MTTQKVQLNMHFETNRFVTVKEIFNSFEEIICLCISKTVFDSILAQIMCSNKHAFCSSYNTTFVKQLNALTIKHTDYCFLTGIRK